MHLYLNQNSLLMNLVIQVGDLDYYSVIVYSEHVYDIHVMNKLLVIKISH